jgi:hypothetical protein
MGYKKKNEIDMGNYTANPSEFNAFKWCIDNGIYISPKANTTLDWYICITMNGKSNMSHQLIKNLMYGNKCIDFIFTIITNIIMT